MSVGNRGQNVTCSCKVKVVQFHYQGSFFYNFFRCWWTFDTVTINQDHLTVYMQLERAVEQKGEIGTFQVRNFEIKFEIMKLKSSSRSWKKASDFFLSNFMYPHFMKTYLWFQLSDDEIVCGMVGRLTWWINYEKKVINDMFIW